MKKEDFVVLVYSQNNCYTSVLSVKEAEKKYKEQEFSLDIDKKTWTFKGDHYSLAKSRWCARAARWGVISVYNRLNDKHLDLMVGTSKEATSSESCSD